jgi:hypothetical protein
MHWFSYQVTILVHLTYRINPLSDPEVSGLKWIKESHFYILDDKEHNTMFVQHCLLLHRKWLCEKEFKPRQHWVFNDGCSFQFKGSRQCTLLHDTLDLQLDVLCDGNTLEVDTKKVIHCKHVCVGHYGNILILYFCCFLLLLCVFFLL